MDSLLYDPLAGLARGGREVGNRQERNGVARFPRHEGVVLTTLPTSGIRPSLFVLGSFHAPSDHLAPTAAGKEVA